MDRTEIITQFIVEEFLPDLRAGDLDPNHDLLATGVIDSLGLLVVIAWLEKRFGLELEDHEITPESFHSVNAIDAVVERAHAARRIA